MLILLLCEFNRVGLFVCALRDRFPQQSEHEVPNGSAMVSSFRLWQQAVGGESRDFEVENPAIIVLNFAAVL